jgi:protocatechuate 3,4-dioxygenase beta subunit
MLPRGDIRSRLIAHRCTRTDAKDVGTRIAAGAPMRGDDDRRVSRRRMLEAFGMAAGAAVIGACGSNPASPGSVTSTTSTTAGTTGSAGGSAACAVAASETQGPYPDTTGMLNNPAFFRQDVTEGRSGVPVMLALTIVNAAAGCAPLSNANVEIWQCDAEGHYSEYAQPGYNGTGQTFLRGLQTTDANGRATFRTIYPGWYQGRATHIHVEVFVNGRSVKVTQIAFPESVSAQVYRTSVYATRGQNPTSNASDMVFSDGTSTELATLTGDAASGLTATIALGVSV